MDECIPIHEYAFEMQSSNCPFLVSSTDFTLYSIHITNSICPFSRVEPLQNYKDFGYK